MNKYDQIEQVKNEAEPLFADNIQTIMMRAEVTPNEIKAEEEANEIQHFDSSDFNNDDFAMNDDDFEAPKFEPSGNSTFRQYFEFYLFIFCLILQTNTLTLSHLRLKWRKMEKPNRN